MDQPDRHDIGWELYRSYLGVLREGSLSGAARALGVTQPTVGRHIAALEQALGLVLFTRSQQGLLPTRPRWPCAATPKPWATLRRPWCARRTARATAYAAPCA